MSAKATSGFFLVLIPYFVFQMEYDKYFCNNSDSDSFNFLIANKPADSDWCVLSVTNVEAYLGSSALSRMYLGKLIGTVIERQKCGYNVPYLHISCH